MRALFPELAWTALRVASGALLAFNYGYGKVFGGKISGLANLLAESGFPFPHFFAWCAGLTEFFGGILVAIGLATRGAAALVCVVMAVALWQQHRGGLIEMQLPLLFLAPMLNFAAAGGRFGLDTWLTLRV